MVHNNIFMHMLQAALLSAALLVFSCSKEIPFEAESTVQDEPAVRTVHFNASLTQTKARFGQQEDDGAYPTFWTDNDSQVKLSLNYGGAVAAQVTPTSDYRSASFDADVDFTGVTGPYTFYCVSPASAAYALSPSREAWKVTIPCVQTPTAQSVDEAGIILTATSGSYTSAAEVENVDMFFNHLTAYGRMSLTNLDLQQGESITAVELTTTTPIVGDWYWKTTGTEIIDYGASSTLTINTSSASNIWFACAPVDVSDEVMSISVFTSLGVFEHMIQFPEGRSFEAGRTAVFSVNMAEASFTASSGSSGSSAFELVTDASTLAVGDEVLIVSTTPADENVALGASYGNYRLPASVTVSNNAISDPGEATVLTLKAGTSDGTFALFDGSYYLSSPTTDKNYLLSELTSVNDNASWTIVISNGTATVTAKAGSRTLLRYNSSSPRFSCYSSGQTAVSIYRRSASGGGVSADDPLLQESAYGCYLGTGLEWEYNPGAEQVTRSYDTNGVQTYTLIDPAEVEELEIVGYKKSYVKGDSFTVSVQWRKGISTIHSESYNVTLIKEEGPKVWLSDGTHGVIIKK